MKALVIDDDSRAIKDVTFCLQVRYPDIDVVAAVQGQRGIELLDTESPDIVLVGSSLPDISTLDLIKKIRELSDVALIVLSEKQTDLERAEELENGADDYIIKPFSPIELLAKVSALLRRVQGLGFKPHRLVTIGTELTIDFSTREVFLAGERLNLTPTEYNLLSELVRNEGRVLTHNALLEKVWGPEYDSSFVKNYIHRLRSKVEPNPSHPQLLLTERGIGYKFTRHI